MTGPIIDPDEVAERLDDPTLRVVDVRWYLSDPTLGAVRYAEGHVPGAVFLDLEDDLSDTSVPDAGRHPLPDRQTLATRLGEVGIGSGHDVVAYDDASGSIAARAWWLLRWLGHERVAVLDGGWPAWVRAGHPVSRVVPDHPPAMFAVSAPLTTTVGRAEVADRAGAVLVDARAPERFRGETEPVDPVAGHIPGAVNLPTGSLVDGNGRFLAPEALAGRLAPVLGDGRAMASCGSGVTACAVILAAVAAGLPEPALYPGSYSEWSMAGLPTEQG